MGRQRPHYLRSAFFAAVFFIAGKSYPEVHRVNDLSGGINDAVPGSQIGDNEAVSIVNMHVDPISRGLRQRAGSSKKNTTQLSGSVAVDVFNHTQSDGDSFLISIASKTISYSVSAGSSWTSVFTTATLNQVWDGVSYVDDNFYMVNQVDGGWYFNGTAILAAGSMPAGKYIEAYQNRLFAANTSAFPYRVFFSGLLQPSTWTTSTDYFDMPEAVSCLGEPFDGGLPIYTKNTTWMLRGTGPTNFELQQISGQIGCAENRDVQNFDILGTEYQVFLSLGPNGSRKSLYALLGNRIVDLGRKIPNLMDDVSVFDTSARSHSWDTDDDFNLGTTSLTYVSSTEEAVKLSTATDTDTTTADFTAGSTSSTTVISDRVYLSTNNTNITNHAFEDDLIFPIDGWTGSTFSIFSSGGSDGGAYMAPNGSCSTDSDADDDDTSYTFLILSTSSVTLLTSSGTTSISSSWSQKTTSGMSAFSGRWVKVRLVAGNGGSETVDSDVFLANGTEITFYTRVSQGTPPGQKCRGYDQIQGGRSTIYSGTFTGATFDTGFSSAAWIASSANSTANGHSITFQTQESSNGSSWDSAVSWTPGSQPSSDARKRYKRYIVTLSTGGTTNGTALPYVDDATLSARVTSGTYTSESRDGGADIASWDIFSASLSGGNSHSFFYRTAASTTALASASWNAISNNSDVAGSARYFQWKDEFLIIASTDDPTVNSVTQNYTASAGAAQPGDMEIWNNDLWMTYTSPAGTYNDSIILMNDEAKFSKISGLTVYGFAAHRRGFYAGTSLNDGSNGGYVRQLDTGATDDGAAVTSSVQFKHQEFDIPSDVVTQDYEKNLAAVYFNYGVDAGTFTATISENFDDEETDYTVEFDAFNTVGRWRLEADPGTTARQFGIGFENSYPGSKLNLYPPITYHYSKSQLIPQP